MDKNNLYDIIGVIIKKPEIKTTDFGKEKVRTESGSINSFRIHLTTSPVCASIKLVHKTLIKLNLKKEYRFELFQTENFSAEIIVRCTEKCHEPRLTNLRDLMGYIVIVGNVQPAESGKTRHFTRFYLERDIHEVTVISRYNPYLDEYLQV